VALYRQESIPGFGKIRQIGLGDLKGRKGVYRYEQRDAASDFIEVQEQAQVAGLDDVLMRKLGRMGVSKSSHLNKADVRINDVLASVKMGGVGKSSLINHQARSGFLKVFKPASDSFMALDAEVIRYIKYRRQGVITEDVGLAKRKEMGLFISEAFKGTFKQIFDYFVFEGTPHWGPSAFPAECVLLFDDAFEPSTWKSFKRDDFFEYCWPRLVFSLRRHGKANYTLEDEPWVLPTDDGNPKGKLSLRI
jgi:hypothetical protein